MTKTRSIFYYFTPRDLEEANRLAKLERHARCVAFTRDASTFHPDDAETCDKVVVMEDVPDRYATTVLGAYGRKATRRTAETPAQPEPAVMEMLPLNVVPPPTREEPVDLELLTRQELRDYASSHGVTLDPNLTLRADIIAAIVGAHPSAKELTST